MIEIEDVLEATIVSGFRNGPQVREDLALDLLVLGGRLDHEIAVGRVRRALAPTRDALEHRLAFARLVELALGDLSRQQAVDRGERRVDPLLRDVVSDTTFTPDCAQTPGDAGAHLSGPDDADSVIDSVI